LFKGDSERVSRIKDEAVEHVREMQELYGGRDHSIDSLLKKAANIKKKKKIDDDVYEYMTHLIPESFNKNKERDDLYSTSALGHALGSVIKPDFSRSRGRVSVPKEGENAVDAIKKIASMNPQNHANGMRQSMWYTHNDHVSLSAFRLGRHNPQMHVHPILFALFVNRIPELDKRVLWSNMARAITFTVDGRQPMGADFELMVDMTHDNNAYSCDKYNIWNDLLKRVQVQEMLRELVIMFRNGHIYNVDTYRFLEVLNTCKMAPQDNPHLMYHRDEGTLLRKILSAFSFYPIKMATLDSPGAVPNMVHPQHTHASPYSFSKRWHRSTIEVRVPIVSLLPAFSQDSMVSVTRPDHRNEPSDVGINVNNPGGLTNPNIIIPVDLLDAVQQQQMYHGPGGMLIPRVHRIIYVQDLLVFYVNRRMPSVVFQQREYQYTRLPMNPMGHDHANIYPVKYQEEFHGVGMNHDTFKLQTVVLVDCNLKLPTDNVPNYGDLDNTDRANWRENGNQVITGCSTLWIQREQESRNIDHVGAPYDRLYHNDQAKVNPPQGSIEGKRYMHYDPLSVITQRTSTMGSDFDRDTMTAVSEITDQYMNVKSDRVPSFEYLASHYGTIYVYKRYHNMRSYLERDSQVMMGIPA
jgi:hypothetical protein